MSLCEKPTRPDLSGVGLAIRRELLAGRMRPARPTPVSPAQSEQPPTAVDSEPPEARSGG
jgi:hypothetical protein